MGSGIKRTNKNKRNRAVKAEPVPARAQSARESSAKLDTAAPTTPAASKRPIRSSPLDIAKAVATAATPAVATEPRRTVAAKAKQAATEARQPVATEIKRAAPQAPVKRRATTPPKKHPKAPPFFRKPFFETLEPRLLLSADLNPAAQDTVFAMPAMQGAEYRALVEPGAQPSITSMQVAPIQRTNEIAFVDTATRDYQQLVDDMRGNALAQGRDLEVVLIDAEQDGIRKITDTLAQKANLDAIHIVSHAVDGAVQLGAAQLDFATLAERSTAIRTWGNALTDDGDLLIYGCDLAATQAGQSLVDEIARVTGADVAASEDPTGAASRGGNWKLEFTTGAIEAKVAVSAAEQARWDALLAPPVVNLNGSSGTITVSDRYVRLVDLLRRQRLVLGLGRVRRIADAVHRRNVEQRQHSCLRQRRVRQRSAGAARPTPTSPSSGTATSSTTRSSGR